MSALSRKDIQQYQQSASTLIVISQPRSEWRNRRFQSPWNSFYAIVRFTTWRLGDLTLVSLRVNNISYRSISSGPIQPRRSREASSTCIIHDRSHGGNFSSIIFGRFHVHHRAHSRRKPRSR